MQRRQLLEAMRPLEPAVGDALVLAGRPPDGLLLVVSGKARVLCAVTEAGTGASQGEMELLLPPGEVVGSLSGLPASMDVMACADSLYVLLPRAQARRIRSAMGGASC